MNDSITWVGMDDAANKINVAVYLGQESEPHDQFVINNDAAGHGRLIKRLKSLPGEVRCVYEAGVNGFYLQRMLSSKTVHCDIAAPSLTPRQAGNRVKTNRLDARKLTKLYRSGELTLIVIPGERQESLRDLIRAREDAMEDQQRARHRLKGLLLRHGKKYGLGKAWTAAHLRWLKSVRFDHPPTQRVLEEYRLALDEETERMKRFDALVVEEAKAPEYQKLLSYLMGFRGIQVLTAMTIIAEAIDLKRFTSARALMDAVGVVPCEYSTGDRERRGRITKTGNAHLRRVVIESAWHYRHAPIAGKVLKKRRAGLPPEVLEIVRKADRRLNKRYWHLVKKGKDTRTAAVAVARELLGFIWAMGQVA